MDKQKHSLPLPSLVDESDYPRLIEHAFPLRQASIDSVHEKNVRHGHISTLHIWPARRPLAACRAALLATLLPDPGTPEKRKELCEMLAGKVEEVAEGGEIKEITEGGILRWRRETENIGVLDKLRSEIRKANGGRAPKVLDPFAGGGAIPLEAMRLGCDVTASDLNPVAWFILKCTLEYPQSLAGKKLPLPDFILADREFMESFLIKVHGLKKNSAKFRQTLEELGHLSKSGEVIQDEMTFENAAEHAGISLDADIAWHVRAWGRKVLTEARKELSRFYPTYAEWQPLKHGDPFEPQPIHLIEPDKNGIASADKLNSDLSDEYLNNKRNPRWVAKPPVAYLLARTVTCKNCRASLPLLKTRWVCKKDNRRVILGMESKPDKSGVTFWVEENVRSRGGNAAQKREHDKKIGAGTMSRAGAQCPCCHTIMTTEDIRYEGRNGRLGQTITAVVVDSPEGKAFRLPTDHEREVSQFDEAAIQAAFADVPFGVPDEPLPPKEAPGIRVPLYGFDRWRKLFTDRQLVALATLVSQTRKSFESHGYDDSCWGEAVVAYLSCGISRLLDFANTSVQWKIDVPTINHSFARFALPMVWDCAEGNPIGKLAGSYLLCIDRICTGLDTYADWTLSDERPRVERVSAITPREEKFDCIITDPPYYDAIPYSDLMDFFYVWVRRTVFDLNDDYRIAFRDELSPKWNHETSDGELIDDSARHEGNAQASKNTYEDGIARAFQACHASLADSGRFVVVFAHKHPDAWETLVAAIIRAGFVVDGSWPIATEQQSRMRAQASAALASSVWLVCRKRNPQAKAGWDNRVMAEMRENIVGQLREFWDAGIRGPDFVWAATGPAMEAYSKYPAVKKANSPSGDLLTVGEFLESVRRMVIEFVVGRVLRVEAEATDRLDSVTSYYLLHRNDFAFEKAPAGACILYAVSCGLSDADLERTWNLIKVKGSKIKTDPDDEDSEQGDGGKDEGSSSEFTLRTWKERKEKRMGYEAPGGREVPLIDRIHRVMHLWKEGDVRKVDEYLDDYALRRNDLFLRVIQSLIELSDRSGEERPLLESLSNHLGARAAKVDTTMPLKLDTED
jgi:adenine-specific DNA methylase